MRPPVPGRGSRRFGLNALAFQVLFVAFDLNFGFHPVLDGLFVSIREIHVFNLHAFDAQVGVFGKSIDDSVACFVVQLLAVPHGTDGGELAEDGFDFLFDDRDDGELVEVVDFAELGVERFHAVIGDGKGDGEADLCRLLVAGVAEDVFECAGGGAVGTRTTRSTYGHLKCRPGSAILLTSP